MVNVLINEESRVCAVKTGNIDSWDYPEGFTLIETDFEFDPGYELSDYIYNGETFVIDEQGIAEREANAAYDPVQTLVAIFTSDPQIIENLPDSDLAHMAPYMQAWEIGVEYSVGDMRNYNERPYRCLQRHTSQESWNPEDAPSLWARILSGQGGDIGV